MCPENTKAKKTQEETWWQLLTLKFVHCAVQHKRPQVFHSHSSKKWDFPPPAVVGRLISLTLWLAFVWCDKLRQKIKDETHKAQRLREKEKFSLFFSTSPIFSFTIDAVFLCGSSSAKLFIGRVCMRCQIEGENLIVMRRKTCHTQHDYMHSFTRASKWTRKLGWKSIPSCTRCTTFLFHDFRKKDNELRAHESFTRVFPPLRRCRRRRVYSSHLFRVSIKVVRTSKFNCWLENVSPLTQDSFYSSGTARKVSLLSFRRHKHTPCRVKRVLKPF